MSRLRLRFSKTDYMVYISHLDMMRLFQRIFRRIGIRVKYTEGYNPQPKIAFATALALGVESDSEYMDIELEEEIDKDELRNKLNANLPEGIKILGIIERGDSASIMSLIEWGIYDVEIELKNEMEEEIIKSEIYKFLELKEIIDIRVKKKKKKIIERKVNIRPMIKTIEINSIEGKKLNLNMFLKTGSNGNIKPEIVLEKLEELSSLEIASEFPKIYRRELLIEEDGILKTPIKSIE